MCGRAALGLSDQQLVALFSSRPLPPNQQQQYQPSYNIRPTSATPIIRRRQDENELVLLNWGIQLANSSKNVINARSEGISHKPMFRSLVDKQRCIMPVIAFYEWTRDKRPHLIKSKDQIIMNLACLYTNSDTFVIITCPAAPAITKIHDRMPVVLTDEQRDRWLDVDQYSFADCRHLLAPFKGEMEFWQVNPLRGNDQSCIKPSPQTSIAAYLGGERKRTGPQLESEQHAPKKVKPEPPHDVNAAGSAQSHGVNDEAISEKIDIKVEQERISSPKRSKPRMKSSCLKPAVSSDQNQSAITDFFKRKQS